MTYLGNYFIYTAALCSLASLVLYFLAWRGRNELVNLARNFFRLTAVFAFLAMGTLLYLILTHDFRVAYVFSYSSTDLPLYYLIASLWGGQEGTFLLWLVYIGVMGTVMIATARQFERGNMFFINLFALSLLFILIKKSPFEVLPVFRAEGNGLNPLLQNYWMTIHPPIMFIGFAAAAFPFSFALTALVERKYQTWSEAARKWTLFAWTALGVSLVMGGYWAYETLGWGGFWAWDPVENSSLIPWLFLTAQVHALFIKRQRRGLLRFSLFVVLLSFWAVLYGTFLTRSGVLADFSVHSFVDLGINQFLVGGLMLFVVIGVFLLAFRWRDISPEASFSKINSRSYLVALGIVIITLGGILVLLGTSSPLLTRFTDNPSNVGKPYYFTTMTPIGVALLLLIALFPSFRWNQGISRPKLLAIGSGAAVITAGMLLLLGVTSHVLYLLLFGFGAWAVIANGTVLVDSWRRGKLTAGYLSHVGLALALIGAAASAGFTKSEVINLPQGRSVTAMGYTFKFVTMTNTPKGFDCHVDVTRGDEHFRAVLPHEFPRNMEGVMKKPFIANYLTYDLYLSPLSVDRPQGVQPGELILTKGESVQLDKYTITFHDFEMSGHGSGDSEMSAAARLTIAHDGVSEDVAPMLRVVSRDVTPVSASFDNGQAEVSISGVRPEDGGVVLQVSGDFLNAGGQMATLAVDVSRKPLINLFWLGTMITFAGGIVSLVKRRRRRQAESTETALDEPKLLSRRSA